jgi:hypothetical protein
VEASCPSHQISTPLTVTIECLNENIHSHTLERSRELAPAEIAIKTAGQEASKGYAQAQVLNVCQGARRVEGNTS